MLADSEQVLARDGQEEPARKGFPGRAQAHSPEIFPATCTPMVTPKPKLRLTLR